MTGRNTVQWVLWRLGLAAMARAILVSGKRFVLTFHGVSRVKRDDLPQECQPYLDQTELHQVLTWLKAHFNFLSPEGFLNGSQSGVLLTFDDGLANNAINVLPLLETFRSPAVFFVTTQHVRDPGDWLPATRRMRRLGWGQERAVPPEIAADFYDGMSAGQLSDVARSPWVTVGSHSVTHPFLSHLEPTKVRFELNESRRYLQQVTGQTVDLFAYPTGDYNRSVAEMVRECGYRVAFAMDPSPVGLPQYEIPRVGVYDSHPAYMSLKLSGLHRRALDRSNKYNSTNL